MQSHMLWKPAITLKFALLMISLKIQKNEKYIFFCERNPGVSPDLNNLIN